MIKFRLLKDWNVYLDISGNKKTLKLFDKGHEFEPNDKEEYIIEYINGGKVVNNINDMRRLKNEDGSLLFEEINNSKYEIIIEEVPDDDDIQVKNWRIQLDVKTTRKKLQELESLLLSEIRKIVN